MCNSDFSDPLDETHAMALEARTEIRREFLAARRTVALWHPRPEPVTYAATLARVTSSRSASVTVAR